MKYPNHLNYSDDDVEYKYRCLVYPNITYQKDFSKDSYYIIMSRILEHLTKREGIVLFDNVYYTPILIQSLAEAVHELIDIQAKGIINVVGDEKISKFEFGLKLAKQFNLNAKFICPGLLEDKTSLVQRPHDMSLSNNKIIGLLGRGFGTVDEGIALLYQQKKNYN